MTASGIPGHITIIRSIKALEKAVNALSARIDKEAAERKSENKALLNNIVHCLDGIPSKVKTMLDEDFNIEGSKPVTKTEITDIVTQTMERCFTRLEGIVANLGSLSSNSSSSSSSSNVGGAHEIGQQPHSSNSHSLPLSSPSPLLLHQWPGEVCACRYVPYNFVLFTGSTGTAWILWHLGNQDLRVGPYKRLKEARWRNDLRLHNGQSQRESLDKMGKVMGILEQLLIEQLGTPSVVITAENADQYFRLAYPLLVSKCYEKPPADMYRVAVTTLAVRLYRLNKRAHQAVPAEEGKEEELA